MHSIKSHNDGDSNNPVNSLQSQGVWSRGLDEVWTDEEVGGQGTVPQGSHATALQLILFGWVQGRNYAEGHITVQYFRWNPARTASPLCFPLPPPAFCTGGVVRAQEEAGHVFPAVP